jgi:flagellar biosynthesis protein FliR
VLGLLVALPGWALLGAAATSEEALGIRGSASLTLLMVSASLAAALALGVHRPLIHAALASFEAWAIAEPSTWIVRAPALGSGRRLATQVHAMATLGLALATPVLLTRAVLELGVGSLARTGASTAALLAALLPGLRLAAGLIALGAAWSSYPEAFARGL